MSSTDPLSTDAIQLAYERGRSVGLASSALAMSVIAFLNLLSIEKSLLAIVLAVLVLMNSATSTMGTRRARAALAIAGAHLVTVVFLFVVFRRELGEFFERLVQLAYKLG